MKKRYWLILFILPLSAWSRSPDGSLDILLIPNNGMPAILQAGASFETRARAKGELRLFRDGDQIPLVADWREIAGGIFSARCTTPPGLAQGFYALEWVANERSDTNTRSVFIVDSFPVQYSIVHLTDVHIGSNRYPKPSEQIFRELISAVNQRCAEIGRVWKDRAHEGDAHEEDKDEDAIPPVAFAVVTGDLTESGEMSQYAVFLELLDLLEIPTYVCAGNHDRKALNYEHVFYQLYYNFTFGNDGYLVFDTKDYHIGDEAGPQDGDLERLRQSIISSRWAIGVTHRYHPTMSMRAQLTLFVDNPLDYLLYGHVHRESKPEEQRVPWGTTSTIITPAAIDGVYRIVVVQTNRVLSLPIEQPVQVR